MKLIIGGRSQGKLNYVLRNIDIEKSSVWDGKLPDSGQSEKLLEEMQIVIYHLHDFVRESMMQGKNPEKEIMDFLNRNPDCIIISDEIGNGIVPMDVFEREYREQTGRILIALAKQADEVVRVICGIGQKIK